MEVAITKMSKNGQIVIPSEVRIDAGLEPFTKFIVFNQEGNILLKKLKIESLSEDMKLLEKIHKSEDQIKRGKFTKSKTNMKEEEIDDLLMN